MSNKQLNAYALASSLKRDDQLFKAKQLIDSNQVKTVQALMKQLNKSQPTILGYLKDLNISMYNAQTKKMTKTFNDQTIVIYPV